MDSYNVKRYNTKKSNWIDYVCLPIICLVSVVLFMLSMPKEFRLNNLSTFVIITFVLNLIIFVIFLVDSLRRYNFSIHSIIWIFNIFFFFFVPMIQFLNNKFPLAWSGDECSLLNANLIILLFSLIYELIYQKISRCKHKKIVFKRNNGKFCGKYKISNEVNNHVLNILTILCFIFLVVLLLRVDIKDIFGRNSSSNAFALGNMSYLSEIIFLLVKYCTVFVFSYHGIILMQKRKSNIYAFLLSGICFIIICFPFSLTRFLLATIYVGLSIIFIKKMRYSRILIYFFILLFMLVFPIVGRLRSFSFFSKEFFNTVIDVFVGIEEVYFTCDYDAYINFVRCLEYVSNNGTTNGIQLLGIVLFFIPRVLWISKPIGSGAMISKSMGESFTNLSMPYIGEGFINWGLLGVVLFAVILAFIVCFLDYNYWKRKSNFWFVLYPFLISLFFFLMRGDVMTGVAQIIGIISIYSCIYVLLFAKKRGGNYENIISK